MAPIATVLAASEHSLSPNNPKRVGIHGLAYSSPLGEWLGLNLLSIDGLEVNRSTAGYYISLKLLINSLNVVAISEISKCLTFPSTFFGPN